MAWAVPQLLGLMGMLVASAGSTGQQQHQIGAAEPNLQRAILIKNGWPSHDDVLDEQTHPFNHKSQKELILLQHHRQLENTTSVHLDSIEAEQNETGSKEGPVIGEEEELPSCNDVLLHETIQDRCNHANNCEGEYIMTKLLPLAFCNDPSTPSPLDSYHPILRKSFPIIFPISLIILTLLLFRLLGSTAENYFSPALEMLSSEFQIVSYA